MILLLTISLLDPTHTSTQVFDETCSHLKSITGSYLCENVDEPKIEEREGWPSMGSYDYRTNTVIIRSGLRPSSRVRVVAHEMTHHILHVSGVASVDKGYDLMCVSEVYAHEVTSRWADAHGVAASPGEINWLPRYDHCWKYIDDEVK